MYIDLIVLILIILAVIMFFKRFDSFVYAVAIVDIFLRILSFIKNNIGLKDVSNLISKYLPDNIFAIINKYSSGLINTILKWGFVLIMTIFLSYVIKIFIKKKKI